MERAGVEVEETAGHLPEVCRKERGGESYGLRRQKLTRVFDAAPKLPD